MAEKTKHSYDEMIERSSRFIAERIGSTEVDTVYFDPVMEGDRITGLTLVSNNPLPGYVAKEGVFVKELSHEDIERYQESLERSMKPLGSYRSRNMDSKLGRSFKYLLEGAWESIEAIQKTLGVGDKYAITRPHELAKSFFHTTDTAVLIHELTHARNESIGHKSLEEIASKAVNSALREKLRYFGGFRNCYLSDELMLDEGIAYLAEYTYLRENEPEKWQIVEESLEKIAENATEQKSHQIVPYIILKGGKEQEVFAAMKEAEAMAVVA